MPRGRGRGRARQRHNPVGRQLRPRHGRQIQQQVPPVQEQPQVQPLVQQPQVAPAVDIQPQNQDFQVPLGEVDVVNFDEPELVPQCNEVEIFVSNSTKEKIWNFDYIDLALLHKSNFHNQNDQIILTVSDGKLVLQPKKLKKVYAIDSIDAWTDAFIAYMQVLLIKHKSKASELLSYLSTIREAAKDASKDQWYTYDQQFRLRVSRDHTKKWSEIDTHLWLRFISARPNDFQSSNRKICYDYNFKGICVRRNCFYMHICLKCRQIHSALNCNRFVNTSYRQNNFVQPGYNKTNAFQKQKNAVNFRRN